MTGSEQTQTSSDDKRDSLWNNGIFLFFFSASMAFMVVGLLVDGYICYRGMQNLKANTPATTTDYSKVEEKKAPEWNSGTVKRANMIKTGTLVVKDKLEVNINDISFCKEMIANPAKVYSQILYLKYTYKNTNSDEPLAVTLDDLDIRDRSGTSVEYYPIEGQEPIYKKVNRGEECAITVPVATLHASADLKIGLNMKDNNLKSRGTLLIKMG